MDQKAHLRADGVTETVRAWSDALQGIGEEWSQNQKRTKLLLHGGTLERLVPRKLLAEGLEMVIRERSYPEHSAVLFMDRAGGGEGAKAAAEIMPLLSSRWSGISLIHVSFRTPTRGIGILVRSILKKAGVDNGIDVHSIAYDRPVQGLESVSDTIRELTEKCGLVVTFASDGASGLEPTEALGLPDALLRESHIAVLSYPDPDSLVGGLPDFRQLIDRESIIDGIRFDVEVQGENGDFELLGSAVCGVDGDAEERLWLLLDNARRRAYRVLAFPLQHGYSVGMPLVYACRTLVEKDLAQSTSVLRVVPAGEHFAVVARGNATLL